MYKLLYLFCLYQTTILGLSEFVYLLVRNKGGFAISDEGCPKLAR